MPEQAPGGELTPQEGLVVPLEWYIPEDLISRFATNVTVQHTEHEFVISFFETHPPIVVGSPDERRAAIERIGSVRAKCVARIIITPGRMPEFISALQENLQTYRSQFAGDGEKADE